jgi:hypothetical protein
MMPVGVIYNRFPEIAAAFPEQLHKVVVQTVEITNELAEANAPKATEFMASNIYHVTSDGSTYGQGKPPPTDDVYLLPEGPPVSDPYTGYTACAANYSAPVNYGHHSRSGSWVPAQPFWEPALDEGRSRFEAALAVFWSFME